MKWVPAKSSQSLASIKVIIVVESLDNKGFALVKCSSLVPPLEVDGVVVTTAKRPPPEPVVENDGGKSSMLTEELESENSEPPEAKLASLFMPPPPTLSMHLVIIDGKVFLDSLSSTWKNNDEELMSLLGCSWQIEKDHVRVDVKLGKRWDLSILDTTEFLRASLEEDRAFSGTILDKDF